MDNEPFDTALIGAAFRLAGERGWSRVSIAAAAREAGLDLARARRRFPGRITLLLRFGRLADATALAGATTAGEGSIRDRLFDLLMRRFDALQANRAGVEALMRVLPMRPGLALLLARATERSMAWMLEAAGGDATGPVGRLRAKALCGVWLWALHAWQRDTSEDLAATMAALDAALNRAERLARMGGHRTTPEPEPATPPQPEGDAHVQDAENPA